MTEWLTLPEQQDWRSFISMVNLLPAQFAKDLQDAHGISFSDYEILVRLSESENREMRMSELANSVFASRSRLTHQIDRLVAAGFIERRACTTDRRGSWAKMTEFGWQTLVSAAPDHVQSVRQHLVDVLTPAEFEALGEISRKVLASLNTDLQGRIANMPCEPAAS